MNSTPVRKLFCYPCRKKHRGKNKHFSIEVLGPKGEGTLCRCKQCGHEYVTYSSAGYRQTHYRAVPPNDRA